MTQTTSAGAATASAPTYRPGAIPYGPSGPSFGGILASLTGVTAPRPLVGGPALSLPVQPVRKSGHDAAHSHARTRSAASLPQSSQAALQQAMARENVPASWQAGLQFIMAQESGGAVDVRNPSHSARGLYQLTAANYHFNPHGAASFGNGVEEAQGGIRYIKNRYGTAENAVAFWQQHRWY